MLNSPLIIVKGRTWPASRFHQLMHHFGEYHTGSEACWGEFIVRKADQKVGAAKYGIMDADHS